METIKEVIDELTYRSYAYNRCRTPNITPENWGKIFPDWQTFEKRLTCENQIKEG